MNLILKYDVGQKVVPISKDRQKEINNCEICNGTGCIKVDAQLECDKRNKMENDDEKIN